MAYVIQKFAGYMLSKGNNKPCYEYISVIIPQDRETYYVQFTDKKRYALKFKTWEMANNALNNYTMQSRASL